MVGEPDDAAARTLARARLEHAALVPLLDELAASPGALAGVHAMLENVLERGRIPRTTKELALLATARDLGARRVSEAFARSLVARGLDPAIVDDLVKKGESSRLPDRTQRLLAFVKAAATGEPVAAAALRRDGIGDPELVELAAVAGLSAFLVVVTRTLEGARD